jgi:hypothetical protein
MSESRPTLAKPAISAHGIDNVNEWFPVLCEIFGVRLVRRYSHPEIEYESQGISVCFRHCGHNDLHRRRRGRWREQG